MTAAEIIAQCKPCWKCDSKEKLQVYSHAYATHISCGNCADGEGSAHVCGIGRHACDDDACAIDEWNTRWADEVWDNEELRDKYQHSITRGGAVVFTGSAKECDALIEWESTR